MIAQGTPDLQIHFIDCGQGNMTLVVMPDSTVLLCDCRVTEESEERILDYLRTYIPARNDPESDDEAQWIDWFVSSHRDEDHLHGLKAVNAEFPIRGIVDSGTTSGATTGAQNQYYMNLRRSVRKEYGNEAVVEPDPSVDPIAEFAGVKVYCLCSGVDDEQSDDGHYGNLVVQFEYAGNQILLPGDSDWRSWEEKIMPLFEDSGLLKSTVLVASHHGSRSFFMDVDPESDEEDWDNAYEAHLEEISPSITIISCGEQEEQNHPNPTARERYKTNTKNRQVYLTRDKGTLVGCFYSDGTWTVIPSRFLKRWNYRKGAPSGKSFRIKCEEYDGDQRLQEIQSGAQVSIGHDLRFTAISSGGLIGQSPQYVFEVSNGGVGDDRDHDEIYYKGKEEKGPGNTFRRGVSYEGIHLLRCRAWDKKTRKMKAQEIFVVEGVPQG